MFRWLLLLLLPVMGKAQGSFPAAYKMKTVDSRFKFRGKIQEAWQWDDRLGKNVLITSVLGPYTVKSKETGEETQTIELFAVHYIKTDTGYKALWRMNDLIKECELDHVAEFIKGSTTITDLDKDSIAETKVQYKLACRGDVSPSYMKLIMHEDTAKYALRGSMWLRGASGEDTVFRVTEKNVNLEKLPVLKDEMARYEQSLGRYETEKDFRNAPAAFLVYARKEWLRYVKERFD